MPDCFVTPWTIVCHSPLSTGFPRPEHRSRLLCGGIIPQGWKPRSYVSCTGQVDYLPLVQTGKPGGRWVASNSPCTWFQRASLNKEKQQTLYIDIPVECNCQTSSQPSCCWIVLQIKNVRKLSLHLCSFLLLNISRCHPIQ